MSANLRELPLLGAGQFFGTVIRSIRIADAQLSLVRHEHARTLPVHEHKCAYFCVLVSGGYVERYENVSVEYKPFTMAVHPPRYRHSDEIGEDGSVFFMIELEDVWNEKLHGVLELDSVKVELRGNDLVWLAMRLLRVFLEFDTGTDLEVESLLYELIAGAAHLPDVQPPERPSWLNGALEFIAARYTEPLSMQMIAGAAGVHPVTVARGFRSHHDQTVSEHVARLRVRLACERLLAGDESVAAISTECGFADQSHFTRAFKNVTGSTPAAFRTMVRGSLAR